MKTKTREILELGVLAGSTTVGFIAAGIPGAIVGYIIGRFHDWSLETTLERMFSTHGEVDGTWKVYRYDPTSGHFAYVGVVDARTEGQAIEQATIQIFNARISQPYAPNVWITSQGDIFRVGISS